MNPDWFDTKQIREGLHLTVEHHFFEGNRCNIWLLQGPEKDVIIDTGLGVCDLRDHLKKLKLIDLPENPREIVVICTHVHFDHSGGTKHFDNVYIHENDLPGLRHGKQTETLNYVKSLHFYQEPRRDFSAFSYKVPPTICHALRDGDKVDIGGGQHLEVMHLPGHTRGSIALYYPETQEIFTGDVVYDCGDGGGLLDWLPNSCVRDYVRSANRLIDFMAQGTVSTVYPGHFHIMTPERTLELLAEYAETKDNPCSRGCMSCVQCVTWIYFLFGCFRCCPC